MMTDCSGVGAIRPPDFFGDLTMKQELVAAARAAFEAYDKLDYLFIWRGGPEPDPAAFGIRHGWYVAGERAVHREEAFPEKFYPRFPAEQGVID